MTDEEIIDVVGGLDSVISKALLKSYNEVWDKALLRKRTLLDAIPRFKQELNGELMDEDEGLDLSQVPMCPICGLETANKYEHNLWHQKKEREYMDLLEKFATLQRQINNLIATVQAANQPERYGRDIHGRPWTDQQRWISEEEIAKYSRNPYKKPPTFKSGEKWDK